MLSMSETERMVVVSPHLDDAVLSLGGTIARTARRAGSVEVLTVFGCDPDSEAPAGGWDRRGGFRTEGEAARGRRDEDRRACAVLGAEPVWLAFGDADYERHGGDAEVREAVASSVAGAAAVVLPGFPLAHPDHAWLTELLLRDRIPCRRLGLYVEQPYAMRAAGGRGWSVPPWLEPHLASPASFMREPVGPRDRRAKLTALRQYRSQLPLLGLTRHGRVGLYSFLWREMRAGGEAVAWVSLDGAG
jgi:LmbE family N-acetylglucosaminyl deacetylase